MSWRETTIGEFVEIKHGFAFKSKDFAAAGSHIVLTPGNCHNDGGFKAKGDKEKWFTGEVPAEFLLSKGDLLVVMTDLVQTAPVLGGSFIIPNDDSFLHNQRLGLVKIKNGVEIDQSFLYHLFNTHGYRGQVRGSASGATVRHTSPGRILGCKVRVPDLATQERIAGVLSAYDDLIENNRRRIALLEEAARLLYREWFVHFRFPGHETTQFINGLPEGWERATLGDHVDLKKETVKPEQFKPEDVHIGLEPIPRRSFVLCDWEGAVGLASHKFRFEANDIIFGKIRPYFHKVGFALRNGVASSDAFIWRVREQRLWPLVMTATSSDFFVSVASKTVREGSKMPRADWKVLKDFLIPVPPEDILEQYNRNIFPISELSKALALQNTKLTQARDLLLPRLMDGRIEV